MVAVGCSGSFGDFEAESDSDCVDARVHVGGSGGVTVTVTDSVWTRVPDRLRSAFQICSRRRSLLILMSRDGFARCV